MTSDFNALAGGQDYTLTHLLFEALQSQEDMIIYSLVVEDTFTGSGDFSELENLEVWTDFNYFWVDYDITNYVPTTLIAGPVNPLPGPSPGTVVLPLHFPIVLQKGKLLMMTIKGDISPDADYTTPATHTIRVIGAEVIGLESDTYCDPGIHNPGAMLTIVDRGSVKLWQPESLQSQILINSQPLVKDILTFNLIIDDAEDISLQSFGFNLEGKSGNTFFSIVSSQYAASWHFPAPVSGPFGVGFGPYPTVSSGLNIETTLRYQGGAGIPYAVNGDGFRINSVSVYASGISSGKSITYTTDQVTLPWMYLYGTRPYVTLANDSPQSPLIPGIDRPIASFDILANTGGDISFSASKGNSLTVLINSRCEQSTPNDILFLKDESGAVLASAGPIDICQTQRVTFNFANSDLYIVAGTSKKVTVTADTIDFIYSGDYIQAILPEDDPNGIGWYIPNQFSLTSNNHHADIIFRGNINGNVLTVP
jgi:hypothetical protein